MSTWDSIASDANDALFAAGGETITYSRPGNSKLDPVDEFETECIPDLSVAVVNRRAAERVVSVRLSNIPGGPAEGDRIGYLTKTWTVAEVLAIDELSDIATLGIRVVT